MLDNVAAMLLCCSKRTVRSRMCLSHPFRLSSKFGAMGLIPEHGGWMVNRKINTTHNPKTLGAIPKTYDTNTYLRIK